MINSVFPEMIMFEGIPWRLAYDPNCPDTVLPSINEKDVKSVTIDAVQFPGRTTPIYLILVNILIPSAIDSTGKIIGARRLIGFRTRDAQPEPNYKVQPNELVYYVAAQTDGSVAQQFFNAVTGIGQRPQVTEAEQPDTSWCRQFSPVQPPAQPAPPQQTIPVIQQGDSQQ